MKGKRFALVALGLAATAVIVLWIQNLARDAWFTEYPFPLKQTDRVFDMGVVDANGDGHLDVYTSNHHFRQALLIADGKGGYRDTLSEWGLDQSPAFPRAELSFEAPKPEQPGVYIYWLGTNLIVRAHRTAEIGPWQGSLHVYDPVKVVKQDGFRVDNQAKNFGVVTETRLSFEAQGDGLLVTTPGGQGLPIAFELGGVLSPEQIFVGRGKVSPPATRFSLAMQDRHAHAWADFNDDGVLDVFINRGALAGTLRAHSEDIARQIKDELFISVGPGQFNEVAAKVGIEKSGCSGRHASWVDYDADGLLDLFVNCYDREQVSGDFPKQLYRQEAGKTLHDVAEQAGLGLPDQQMGNLAWFDVDRDGDVDLLAFQDEGLFLYRNQAGTFTQETVIRRTADEARRIGQGKGNYWFYDGKLTLSDYDADGDLDAFSSSKRGNVLLRNDAGQLTAVGLDAVGLPRQSTTASWVDFDNDGLPDLHLVPQGLFQQRENHRFEETGLLAFHPDQHQAAICNWLDFDNDGRLDVLCGLDENSGFHRWWEWPKEPRRKGRWQVLALRNTGPANHWLQVELDGSAGNRQGIGAQVTVEAAGHQQTQEVGATEGSFFSQGHYRLHYGLGATASPGRIVVRWSDGARQEITDATADKLIKISRTPAPALGVERQEAAP